MKLLRFLSFQNFQQQPGLIPVCDATMESRDNCYTVGYRAIDLAEAEVDFGKTDALPGPD